MAFIHDFIVSPCFVTGLLGLRNTKLPANTSLALDLGTGIIIAHDIVEHQQGIEKIGTFEDELLALGAGWVTRGSFGSYDQVGQGYYSAEQVLSHDLDNLLEYLERPLKYRKAAPHIYDESFMSALENIDPIHSNLKNTLLNWLRAGARMQERRFRKFYNPGHIANANFYDIVDAVSKVEIEFQGQQFRLQSKGWNWDWTFEEIGYELPCD